MANDSNIRVRVGLRGKLIAIALPIVLLAFGAVWYVATRTAEQALVTASETNEKIRTQNLARIVASVLNDARSDTLTSSRLDLAAQAIDTKDAKNISWYADELVATKGKYAALIVANGDGRIVASNTVDRDRKPLPVAVVGRSISVEPWHKAALKAKPNATVWVPPSRPAFLTGVHPAAAGVIGFGLPVLDIGDDVIGTLFVFVSLSHISDILTGSQVFANGDLTSFPLIVDARNKPVVLPNSVPNQTLWREHSLGPDAQQKGPTGHAFIVKRWPLSAPHDWEIAVVTKAAAVVAPVNKISRNLLTAFAVGAVLTMLTLVIVATRFVAPIRRLTAGALRISKASDYESIAVETSDEVGLLTHTFNGMLANLHASQQNLEHQIVEADTARSDAEQASAAKSLFLANMSHEIRTPMNAVMGMNDLLLTTELSRKQRHYTETIRTSASTLLAIINEILDFSKIEAGKMQLRERDFRLVDLVEEVGQTIAPAAHAKQLELTCRVAQDLPSEVRGDPDRLRQILMNLTNNAIKFTDSGEVNVTAQRGHSPDLIRFEVRDTGIGIADDDQERLFHAFTQADASHTRRHGGTGLGLAICKQLVEIMDGDISVDSEQGKGSTFQFNIKLVAAKTGKAKPAQASLCNIRTLVADGNATSRNILQDLLRRWDVVASTTNSGPNALTILRTAHETNEPIDAVLVDQQLPEIDGLEVVRRVRASPTEFGTPILIVLTSMEQAHSEPTLADQWLTKPVGQSRLYNCLVNVVLNKPPPTATAAPVPEAPELTANVLLVDDNEINQVVAKEMLLKLGASPDVVSNGQLAVDAVKANRYDIVFMDCQMPVLDGYQACAQIRKWEGSDSRTCVVALTAHAMAGDRDKALAAGMDDYLTKPVTIEALRATLAKWLPNIGCAKDTASAELGTLLPVPSEELELMTEGVVRPPRALSLFVSEGAKQVDAIHSADDRESLRNAAHKLKGSALVLGMPRLADLCLRLEKMARDGVASAPPPMLETLERTFESVCDRLSKDQLV